VILNDLVKALHCQIEDKTFITVDLPLLIIREGTQREDVAPVRISRILELITSGNVILSSPSFNKKTMAGFEGGGVMVLTPKYTFL
jgi:hypothetical protein